MELSSQCPLFFNGLDRPECHSDPTAAVKPPRGERAEMRFLSAAEVGKLADAIDPRYRSLVYVGAYGGLRISEMFGLKWDRWT